MNKAISLRGSTSTLLRAQLLPDFQAEQSYLLDDELIIFKGYSPNGQLHFVWPSTLLPVTYNEAVPGSPLVDIQWAIEAIAEGRLIGLSEAKMPIPIPQYTPEEVEQIDPAAEYRVTVLRALDAIGSKIKNYHIVQVMKSIEVLHPEMHKRLPRLPAVRTVKTWLKSRGQMGERTHAAAMSKTGRVPRKRRLHSASLDVVYQVGLLFYADHGMSKTAAYDKVVDLLAQEIKKREADGRGCEHLKIPCRTTVGRILDDMACYDTFTAKFGARYAKKFFRGNGTGLRARRILELCAIDHTVLDCIAVDGDTGAPIGRPVLTVMLDVYSRCVLSFVLSFDPPGLSAALECLRRASLPKLGAPLSETFPALAHIYGKPTEIVCDNGLEFVGTSFRQSLYDLGIAVRFCPVKQPQYKATMERFFGTLNSTGIHNLPGTTLNVQKRLLTDINTRGTASMSLHDLESQVARAISNYHIDEHSTLRQPPAAVWADQASKRSIPRFRDAKVLEQMLGTSETRTLTRKGIRLFELDYCGPAVDSLLHALVPKTLAGLKAKQASVPVSIKYNPMNLRAIHVWNDIDKTYVQLPCTDIDYAEGLTKFHHQTLQTWAREKGRSFSTPDQRRQAKVQAREERYVRDPKLKSKDRKSVERLKDRPAVQKLIGPISDLVPELFGTVPQQPFADYRDDGGELPVSKRRGGRKAAATRKKNRAAAAAEKQASQIIPNAARPHSTSRYFDNDSSSPKLEG